ncbi:MAG: glycerophosphodiester phosphodiesterase family protein [Parvibaculum sp.]
MPKPLQIAHRGGAGLWPENTMGAFRHALEFGADGIELDVHLTRDGIPVVHHDESLKPAIARGPDGEWLARPTPLIKSLDYQELSKFDLGRLRPGSGYGARYPHQIPSDGERAPKLEEVFGLVKESGNRDFHIYVELKTSLLDLSQSSDPETLAESVVSLIRKMEMERQVTFVSFDWRALVHARKIAPEIPNAFTTYLFAILDPADASAAQDKPGSEEAAMRAASAKGAPWVAGCDWRDQQGVDFAERMLRSIASGPADGWFSWHGDVTAETVKLARELGLKVSCWTVDEPDEMRRLAALGVDAILTDRPDRLREVMLER